MANSYKNKVSYDADLLRGNDKVQWERVVTANLDKLWSSRTGRVMLDELGASGNTVKIVPWYDHEKNAVAGARQYNDGYYPDRPVRDGNGASNPAWGSGTGRGSAVRLSFTPWRWAPFHQPIILLHEMVHAAEQQRGMIFGNQVKSCFDTVAEFDAIVVENICRSEMGVFIRKNHHGFEPLVGDMMLPSKEELKARLNSFRARMPHLTQALANLDIPFNPLRRGARGAP